MKPSKNNPVKHQVQTTKADDQMPKKKHAQKTKVMKYAERGEKAKLEGNPMESYFPQTRCMWTGLEWWNGG